jgi:hypothetical protein
MLIVLTSQALWPDPDVRYALFTYDGCVLTRGPDRFPLIEKRHSGSALLISPGAACFTVFFRILCIFHNVWGLHVINLGVFLDRLPLCVCVFFWGGGGF